MPSHPIHRLARGAALVAAVLLAAGPGRAAAAPAQAAEPMVTVSATGGNSVSATDCKGRTRVDTSGRITVTLTRTGDPAAPLTVALAYGGMLASGIGLPSQATIPAGQSQVVLVADEVASGDLRVSVVDGDGYAVGDPGSAYTGVGMMIADLGCNLGSPRSEQTIQVGETPADIDVVRVAYNPPASLSRSIEGTVPPGTTFHLDGTWEGTATQPGDFFFREHFCDDTGWCPYRADIHVIVMAHDPTTSTTAPAPTPPVPAAAATPVTGTPQLTG